LEFEIKLNWNFFQKKIKVSIKSIKNLTTYLKKLIN